MWPPCGWDEQFLNLPAHSSLQPFSDPASPHSPNNLTHARLPFLSWAMVFMLSLCFILQHCWVMCSSPLCSMVTLGLCSCLPFSRMPHTIQFLSSELLFESQWKYHLLHKAFSGSFLSLTYIHTVSSASTTVCYGTTDVLGDSTCLGLFLYCVPSTRSGKNWKKINNSINYLKKQGISFKIRHKENYKYFLFLIFSLYVTLLSYIFNKCKLYRNYENMTSPMTKHDKILLSCRWV